MSVNNKLDQFIPTPDTFYGVRRQLVNAGIDTNAIPDDWLSTIIAAMTKWQTHTTDGLKFVVGTLGFQWTRGKDELRYDYQSNNGPVYVIDSSKIFFFAGASIEGQPVNPANITISTKVTSTCDSCGCSLYCVKSVRHPGKDRLENYCNGCLSLLDNMKLREESNSYLCKQCSVINCHHKNIKLLANS